jgi:hypothetical protein
LQAYVVSRGQRELFAIPKGRMIAGVIVGVAAMDVEDQAGEPLFQGRLRFGKTMPDSFRKVFVTLLWFAKKLPRNAQ